MFLNSPLFDFCPHGSWKVVWPLPPVVIVGDMAGSGLSFTSMANVRASALTRLHGRVQPDRPPLTVCTGWCLGPQKSNVRISLPPCTLVGGW